MHHSFQWITAEPAALIAVVTSGGVFNLPTFIQG